MFLKASVATVLVLIIMTSYVMCVTDGIMVTRSGATTGYGEAGKGRDVKVTRRKKKAIADPPKVVPYKAALEKLRKQEAEIANPAELSEQGRELAYEEPAPSLPATGLKLRDIETVLGRADDTKPPPSQSMRDIVASGLASVTPVVQTANAVTPVRWPPVPKRSHVTPSQKSAARSHMTPKSRRTGRKTPSHVDGHSVGLSIADADEVRKILFEDDESSPEVLAQIVNHTSPLPPLEGKQGVTAVERAETSHRITSFDDEVEIGSAHAVGNQSWGYNVADSVGHTEAVGTMRAAEDVSADQPSVAPTDKAGLRSQLHIPHKNMSSRVSAGGDLSIDSRQFLKDGDVVRMTVSDEKKGSDELKIRPEAVQKEDVPLMHKLARNETREDAAQALPAQKYNITFTSRQSEVHQSSISVEKEYLKPMRKSHTGHDRRDSHQKRTERRVTFALDVEDISPPLERTAKTAPREEGAGHKSLANQDVHVSHSKHRDEVEDAEDETKKRSQHEQKATVKIENSRSLFPDTNDCEVYAGDDVKGTIRVGRTGRKGLAVRNEDGNYVLASKGKKRKQLATPTTIEASKIPKCKKISKKNTSQGTSLGHVDRMHGGLLSSLSARLLYMLPHWSSSPVSQTKPMLKKATSSADVGISSKCSASHKPAELVEEISSPKRFSEAHSPKRSSEKLSPKRTHSPMISSEMLSPKRTHSPKSSSETIARTEHSSGTILPTHTSPPKRSPETLSPKSFANRQEFASRTAAAVTPKLFANKRRWQFPSWTWLRTNRESEAQEVGQARIVQDGAISKQRARKKTKGVVGIPIISFLLRPRGNVTKYGRKDWFGSSSRVTATKTPDASSPKRATLADVVRGNVACSSGLPGQTKMSWQGIQSPAAPRHSKIDANVDVKNHTRELKGIDNHHVESSTVKYSGASSSTKSSVKNVLFVPKHSLDASISTIARKTKNESLVRGNGDEKESVTQGEDVKSAHVQEMGGGVNHASNGDALGKLMEPKSLKANRATQRDQKAWREGRGKDGEGEKEVLYNVAVKCMRTGQFPEAVVLLRLSAHAGNPFAQLLLGDCYARGVGVVQHEGKATRWRSMGLAAGAPTNSSIDCVVGNISNCSASPKAYTWPAQDAPHDSVVSDAAGGGKIVLRTKASKSGIGSGIGSGISALIDQVEKAGEWGKEALSAMVGMGEGRGKDTEEVRCVLEENVKGVPKGSKILRIVRPIKKGKVASRETPSRQTGIPGASLVASWMSGISKSRHVTKPGRSVQTPLRVIPAKRFDNDLLCGDSSSARPVGAAIRVLQTPLDILGFDARPQVHEVTSQGPLGVQPTSSTVNDAKVFDGGSPVKPDAG